MDRSNPQLHTSSKIRAWSGFQNGLSCPVHECLVESYKRTGTHKRTNPPYPCLLYNLCGCRATKETFKSRPALPLHNGQSCNQSLRADNRMCRHTHKRTHCSCFLSQVSVTLVCVFSVLSPVLLLQGLFSLSPWCSGSPIVIKATRTRAHDSSDCILSVTEVWGQKKKIFTAARCPKLKIHLEMCKSFKRRAEKEKRTLEQSRCGTNQISISKTSLKNLEIDYLAFLWLHKLAPEQRVKSCYN